MASKESLDKARDLINQGVRGKELRDALTEVLEAVQEGDIPEDEFTSFVQNEVQGDPEVSDQYSNAQENLRAGFGVESALIGGALGAQALSSTGLRLLGGSPEILSGGAAGASAASQAAKASPLLKKAAQIIFGKSAKGFLTRAGLVGGIAAFQGLEDERPPGEQFGQPSGDQSDGQTRRPPSLGQPGSPFTVSPTGPNATETEGQIQTPASQSGFNVMVIDHDGSLTGTPGAVAVVSSAEMGLTPDPDLQSFLAEQQLAQTGETLSVSQMMSTYFESGQAAQAAAGSQQEIRQVLFPESMGQVTVDVPFEVSPTTPTQRLPSGEIISPERQRSERIGVPESVRPDQPGLIPTSPGFGDLPGGPTRVTPDPQQVPGGAQLAPRIFREHRGRTLMEWAQLAAQRHEVPLNILYGIIDHESNWLASAQGDHDDQGRPQSFGLGQIYLPAWGNISRAQALNPVFNLNFTAQKLRERFNKYGRWDAAVAAHNHPVAADHLAKTGKFMTDKSAAYVGSVIDKANRSGLATHLFEDPSATPVADTGSTGPDVPAFQAPDPAQSREFVRAQYEELLGREPNEDELKKGVDKINRLARSAYSANVRNLKGAESQEVDIEAQFTEDIRESGEFAFHEEVGQTNDFTDFAASVARLMQQGV